MGKFPCLLCLMKLSYIWYHIICMTTFKITEKPKNFHSYFFFGFFFNHKREILENKA